MEEALTAPRSDDARDRTTEHSHAGDSRLAALRASLTWRTLAVYSNPRRDDLQRYTPFAASDPISFDASHRIRPIALDARLQLIEDLTTHDRAMDRSLGSLVGLAVGDAAGAPLEFLDAVESGTGASRVDIATLQYTQAWNKFRLLPGQWTDDTAMALCLADSLIACGGALDGADVRERFWSWWFCGMNNAFRKSDGRVGSVGLGGNISKSLYCLAPGERPAPEYEATTQDSGNGSIMRLAPVAIAFQCADLAGARAAAAASSRTTHPGAIAAAACAFLAHLTIRAMREFEPGAPGAAKAFLERVSDEYARDVLGQGGAGGADAGAEVLRRVLASAEPAGSPERCWNWRAPTLDIAGTMAARGHEYNGYPNSLGYFGSYAPDALAIAMHAIAHTDAFDAAIERCANCLGDADSTSAVCGQVAGALYGWRAIGPHLRAALHRWDDGEIAMRAALLTDAARAAAAPRGGGAEPSHAA